MQSEPEEHDFSVWREVEAAWRRNPALRPLRRAFRKAKRLVPNAWRLATHNRRQLPSAVIIGAQKAGTTQLYACLTRHPRCFSGATKELHYFTKHSDRSLAWYRSQFPLERTVARAGGLCLEATPSYLPTPTALRSMSKVLPHAKLIVLLRDPVKRAFSHYQHYKSRQLESRTFPEVVRDAIERRAYAPERGAALVPDVAPMLDYVYRGYYALQLEAVFDQFPREQVLILDSADLFDDSNGVSQLVFDYLGLERHDVATKKIHNRGYYRATADAATVELLRDHYRPYDALLSEVTGRRFRWTDEPAAQPGGERSAA